MTFVKSLHNEQRLPNESKMAALAANSEMKTEHLSESLDMLERLITKIHKLCLLRRKETECLVQQCRDLLKPWPPISRFEKKREDSTEITAKAQMVQSGKPTMDGTAADSKATEAEKQDLAALENLLAKAQRAREVQTKIDEDAAKASNKKKASKTPLPVTSKPPVTQPTQQVTKQSSSKPSSKQPTAARKTASQKPATKSTYSASYGRPPSVKSLVRPTSSKGSAKVYLDSVLEKGAPGQMSRSGSSVKGHESSAKTDKGTSVNASKRAGTLTPGEKDPETSSEQSLHALPSKKDPSVSAKSHDKLARDQTTTEPVEFQAFKLPAKNITMVTLNDVDNKSHDLTGRPGESCEWGNLCSQSISEVRDFRDDQVEPFDPFAQGADFALPGKYRKLKATSIRLYSEVRNIAEKGGVSSSCQHFLHRVESEFNMGDICTHSQLQDSANGILEEHETLSRLTRDVVQRSCHLSEGSPWPEVYKCYRHWQMVLSKFNELQRRTQQLLEAEEQLSKQCPCGNCRLFDNPRDAFKSEPPHSDGFVLLSSWLPEVIGDPGSFKDIGSRYDAVEFTYCSLKASIEQFVLQRPGQEKRDLKNKKYSSCQLAASFSLNESNGDSFSSAP